jgi:hypothetical protein
MIPESQADKLLAPIYTTYTDVETTILAHAGDIQLTLLCSKSNPAAAQQRVDELAGRMEEALEDWLYSSGANPPIRSSRSSSTISASARPPSPSPKAAPAA